MSANGYSRYLVALLCMHSPLALPATAVFAGGCFWSMESDIEKLDGVSEVISGFTGGTLKDPEYYGRNDGHREAVMVVYDPGKVSYEGLLDYYWRHIDPFDDEGQFCDKGDTYLSAIFVANDEERRLAEASRRGVERRFANRKVFTPILPATTFYPVKDDESFLQDYYKKYSERYNVYRRDCGRTQRLNEIWGGTN